MAAHVRVVELSHHKGMSLHAGLQWFAIARLASKTCLHKCALLVVGRTKTHLIKLLRHQEFLLVLLLKAQHLLLKKTVKLLQGRLMLALGRVVAAALKVGQTLTDDIVDDLHEGIRPSLCLVLSY